MFSFRKKLEMPAPGEALPGRTTPIPTARTAASSIGARMTIDPLP